jgi:hypothetical protein
MQRSELLLKTFQQQQPRQYAAAAARVQAGAVSKAQWAGASLHAARAATTQQQLLQLAAEDDADARAAAVQQAAVAAVQQVGNAQRHHIAQAVRQAAAAAGTLLPQDMVEQLAAAAAVPGATAADITAAVPSAPDSALSAAAQLTPSKQAAAAHAERIPKELVSNVNKERGRRDEPAALAAAADAAAQPVVQPNQRMYYASIQLVRASGPRQPGVRLRLGGRVDGWLADRSAFVEVKNRQNGLKYHVPVYEHVQVLAYMQCTRVYKCMFTEKYLDSSWAEELVWDESSSELWQAHVLPGLQQHVQQLQSVLCSTAAQDELLLLAIEQGFL